MEVAIEDFAFAHMIELGSLLRDSVRDCRSLEDGAVRVVQQIYDSLRTRQNGERAMALVRFFKTHSFGQINPELQTFARRLLGSSKESPDMKCLVLLATTGELPEWNSRKGSRGHQAIPLPNPEAIEKAPMISQLVSQMGLSAKVVTDSSLMVEMDKDSLGVFHVPQAEGSPYLPAQDFVHSFQIKSVLGFGGLLHSGDLFAVIMFSRVAIPRATAELFKTLGLMTKLAVSRFSNTKVFSASA